MKKILLTMAVVLSALTASAEDVQLYLHYNANTNWEGAEAYPAFNAAYVNPDNANELVWEYTLNSTTGLKDGQDFCFRLKYNDYNNDLCPWDHADYAFRWVSGSPEVYNGKYETYDVSHSEGTCWGEGCFRIKHSEIGASEYKITVYAPKNESRGSGSHYYVKAEIVSMPVTVSAAGFATLTTPRALNFTGTGITAYVGKVENGTATFTQVDQVPAGTGVLLSGAGTVDVPVIANIDAFAEGVNEMKPYQEKVQPTEGEKTNLVLMNKDGVIGFCVVESEFTLTPGTAYLQTATANLAAAPSKDFFEINLGAEVTGINTVKTANQNGVVYDLQGRRVANPTHGIYIVNGKKVVVK